MARKPKHEEHENHERWLISYADFITLLFAFFVVMYAVSSVNEGKYRVLSDSIVAAFRSSNRTLEPIQIGDLSKANKEAAMTDPSLEVITDPAQQTLGQDKKNLGQIDVSGDPGLLRELTKALGKVAEIIEPNEFPVAADVQSKNGSVQSLSAQDAEGAGRDGYGPDQAEGMLFIKKMTDKIEKAMASLIQEGLVAIQRNDLWVEVEIKTSVLFASGSAKLQERAEPILSELGEILREYDVPIRVEGFTDNIPINTLAFPSNWELSAARAATVVHLFTRTGVEPHRMAAIGYGEYRPIADNSTEEGRARNRRVVLIILQSAEVERLFSSKHNAERSVDHSITPQQAVTAPQPDSHSGPNIKQDNVNKAAAISKVNVQGETSGETLKRTQENAAMAKGSNKNNAAAADDIRAGSTVSKTGASRQINIPVIQPSRKVDPAVNAVQLPVITQPLELPLSPGTVINDPIVDPFIKQGEHK